MRHEFDSGLIWFCCFNIHGIQTVIQNEILDLVHEHFISQWHPADISEWYQVEVREGRIGTHSLQQTVLSATELTMRKSLKINQSILHNIPIKMFWKLPVSVFESFIYIWSLPSKGLPRREPNMTVRGSHILFFYLISRLVLFSKSKSVLYDMQPIYGSYRVFLKTQTRCSCV